MKAIKLSETHYIVVDDSEIKDVRPYKGRWYYEKGVAINQFPTYLTDLSECKLITHSTQPLENGIGKSINGTYPPEYPRFDKIKPLSLSEVEEAIYGYSVEKMAMSYLDRNYTLSYERTTWQKLHETTFEAGFNAHKELVKDKLSVNQVIDFYNWLKRSYGSVKPLEEAQIIHRITPDKIVEMYLQSLKEQTEWEVEFDEQGKLRLI